MFGVQLCAASGANAIGVISDETSATMCWGGAKGVINRKDFKLLGPVPTVNSPEYDVWVKEARKFGKAIWDITGKKDVDIVFEHPGEATFPVSCLVAKRGGMVVFCAGTSGFNITFDARYVLDAAEARAGLAFRPISSRRARPTSSSSTGASTPACPRSSPGTRSRSPITRCGRTSTRWHTVRAGLRPAHRVTDYEDVVEALAGRAVRRLARWSDKT